MDINPRRIREIILHAGLHKTGTTSIQNTLYATENYSLLDHKDYLYLKGWPSNHSIPIYSAFCDENEHVAIMNRYCLTDIKNLNKKYLRILENEVTESKKSKLIFSGEAISALKIKNLHSLKEYLVSLCNKTERITVKIYVRHPIDWSVSSIQQIIKVNETYQSSVNIVKYLLRNNFKNSIDKFVKVFGKGNIDVYSFEEAVAHKYGPVGHFLSKLSFEDCKISKFNIIKANEGSSLIALDLISFLNEKMPRINNGKVHEQRSLGDVYPLLDIKGPEFDIPYALKTDLFEVCQEDIKWLKDHYEIDYSFPQKENKITYEFTEETILDIRKIYFSPSLSPVIKDIVIEYLQTKLQNSTGQNKLRLARLLKELGF
jgi:hypothetical protein